jgi:hypothetical protein
MEETEKTQMFQACTLSQPLLMKLFCTFISSSVIIQRYQEKRCHYYQGWCRLKCHLTQQEILPPTTQSKIDQLSQNFIPISNVKFPDTVMKTIIGVKIL